MRALLKRAPILIIGIVTLIAFTACGGGGVFLADDSGLDPDFARSPVPSSSATIRVNVLLDTAITDTIRAEISGIGTIVEEIASINALVVKGKAVIIGELLGLSYVVAANPDAERNNPPVDTIPVEDFADGLSTWNLDVINVTDIGFANRQVPYDGEGVYIAVLDTGLTKNWRDYFPEERIAIEYGRSFGGGGNDRGAVSTQPNKWEHDTDSHGTHVTSTIIGYSLSGTPVNGVAPRATIIPVKVLNQNGSGWSSVVAAGIAYVGDLKAGPLADSPVVINMSLGGPVLDAIERAAIDYAIAQGVLIVASAGNQGDAGMGYPGAYEPVISVGAIGWAGEWLAPSWWYSVDDPEPNYTGLYYVTDFSSRELPGQDLDILAPGSWVVGPYQVNEGQNSYYYLGGTSMASPHVAGIVGLMAQKDGSLGQFQVESILESAALPIAPGSLTVAVPYAPGQETFSWGSNATGSGLITADGALAGTP